MEEIANLRERVASMERRISHLERVIRVSQMLNSTLSLEPLLEVITQVVTELTDTEACSILLLDRKTGELRFRAVTGRLREELKAIPVPLENSIAGWILREKRPLLIRDVRSDPRWFRGVDEESTFETRSLMGVPLLVKGEAIGVVEAVNKRGDREMSWEDVEVLSMLADQAAIAIENARLLAELRQAYAELNELDRMKSDFIAIAAHELRTPLSLILGYAMFLKEDMTGKAKEQLEVVLQAAMRLRSLIGDMINLRQVDTGEARLELEEISLREMIEGAIEEFSSLIEAKGLDLEVELPPDDALILEADRQKLVLVLNNLLSNAIKFTPNEGRIGIHVRRKNGQYFVTVWDTGIGIPAREHERIFERFYQVEPSLSRHYEGMGLGLAIAKEMIELHGGHIWVESEPGRGSAFTFTLPVRQAGQVPEG